MTNKAIFDQYGLIAEANRILEGADLKLDFLAALAELEDNECHRTRQFPKTRLHRVTGVEEAIYRADVNKVSGWRIHLQYKDGMLYLKDLIPGSKHDNVIKVIQSKSTRYD